MSSATSSRSVSDTTTITAGDVRQVMTLTTREITAICQAAQRAARDFDIDSALVDVSILVLNQVIASLHLQVYAGDEIVRDYAFVVAEEVLEAYGPPPEQPPMGAIPAGARIRLTVQPNPNIDSATADEWFERLGWTTAAPLRFPEGVHHAAYGSFTSGGFGVERRLLVNPKYDQPVNPGGPWTKKEL